MIMAWSNREGWPNFVFFDDGRSCGGERERWGMKMRTMWRIQADMRNKGYDLPDWVGRPRIDVNTCRIRTRTCCIVEGKLTRTRNSVSLSFI